MTTEQRFKDNHMRALKAIGFTGSYLTLRRIENQVRRYMIAYCNGESPRPGYVNAQRYEEAQLDRDLDAILPLLKRQFKDGQLPVGFFFNHDPRGAALKLDPEKATIPAGMHKDWGEYGILAPDWNE